MNTAMAADTDITVPSPDSAPATELFVINLCASMTPMPSVPKHLKGFERYKLYQVSKMEDGRRRYRLRLGFFTSEADAELIVGSIRNLYPAAFSSCLSNEDLRYIDGFAPRVQPAVKAVASPPAAPSNARASRAPAAQTAVPAAASTAAGTVPAARTPATPAQRPVAAPAAPPQSLPRATSPVASPAAKRAAPEKELSLEIDLRGTASAPRPAEPAAKAAVVPFHVAAGVEVPDVSLELAPETQSAPATGAPPVLQQKKESPRAAPTVKPAALPAAKSTAPAAEPLPPPPQIVDYIPVLDTTLTLRTLTQIEIDDPNQPKWYVVQLAQSDHPVNLDAMPKLDIFSAYSLYSVAVTTNGTIRHALRLGFFREEVSAEAVSGYLKTFFASPTVARVSTAEYTRFAEPLRRPETPAARAEADKIVPLKRTPAPKQAPAPTAPAKSNAASAAKHSASPYAKITKNGAKPAAKSLAQELHEEARQTLLSESGIRKGPKQQSFLSRLIGRSLD